MGAISAACFNRIRAQRRAATAAAVPYHLFSLCQLFHFYTFEWCGETKIKDALSVCLLDLTHSARLQSINDTFTTTTYTRLFLHFLPYSFVHFV
jgi:hypothetical protein